MQFEILLDEPTWERISLPFVKNLERPRRHRAASGSVDAPQYEYRTDNFDFDMVVNVWRAVALPRQRAARLLGVARRRRAGQPTTSRASAIRSSTSSSSW